MKQHYAVVSQKSAKKSQEKRKTEYDLSQNTNIKKARNRMINFTPLKRDLEMRKNANRQIIDRSIRVLKRRTEYENATKKKEIRLMQKIKENIVIKR
jgi:hypothetical protein